MTFTYAPTSGSNLAKVRLYIGDTDSNDPIFSDEEIDLYLQMAGSNPLNAAINAARGASAKFARLADTKIDSVSVSYSQKAKNYQMIMANLERQALSSASNVGKPIVGGVSKQDVEDRRANSDRVSNKFFAGQFDNPPDADEYYQANES